MHSVILNSCLASNPTVGYLQVLPDLFRHLSEVRKKLSIEPFGCTTKFLKSEKFFFYITPNPKGRKKKNFLEVPFRGFRGERGILSYTQLFKNPLMKRLLFFV